MFAEIENANGFPIASDFQRLGGGFRIGTCTDGSQTFLLKDADGFQQSVRTVIASMIIGEEGDVKIRTSDDFHRFRRTVEMGAAFPDGGFPDGQWGFPLYDIERFCRKIRGKRREDPGSAIVARQF